MCIKYDVENLELFELDNMLKFIIGKAIWRDIGHYGFRIYDKHGRLIRDTTKKRQEDEKTPEEVKWRENFVKTAFEATSGFIYEFKLPENTIVLYKFQITAEDRFQHFAVIAPLVDSLEK